MCSSFFPGISLCIQAIKALHKTTKLIEVRLKDEGWVKSRVTERQGEYAWGCFRDKKTVFVFESLSTHSAVWEQSGSPDKTSKAEGKYTPQPPSPKEGLSVWGPTFLSTQRRLARRQRWGLNLHSDPGSVRIPQPSYSWAGAGGLNEPVRPRGFSQWSISIHK